MSELSDSVTKMYRDMTRLYKAALNILEHVPPGPEKDELIAAILELGMPKKP